MNNNNESVDPTLLKVNGSRGKEIDKEYVKELATAILQTFFTYKVANLRCVGAGSINNADKAIIIASMEAKKVGVELVEKKSFTIATFGNNNEIEKTAILKTIIKNGS